jgi:hypothetical protein
VKTYKVGELLVVSGSYYNILKVIKVTPIQNKEVRVDFKTIWGLKAPEHYSFFNTKSAMAKDVGKMNEFTKKKYDFIRNAFENQDWSVE